MALFVLKQPDQYAYTGNPITLSVVPSAAYTESLGTRKVIEFDFSTVTDVEDGDTFTFNFDGVQLFFIAVDGYTPDDFADKFPSKQTQTMVEWRDAFITALNQNYAFTKNFSITNITATTIRFQYQAYSNVCSIVSSIANANFSSLTDGISPNPPANYDIFCEIESTPYNDPSVKTFVTIAAKPTTKAPYKADFFLENIMDSLTTIELPTGNAPQKVWSNWRKYTLRFLERYGSPLETKAINKIADKICIKGKADWLFMQSVNFNLGDYLSSFLTFQPNYKETNLEQPEFLYFFNKSYVGNLRLRIEVTWEDYTTTISDDTTLAMTANEMWAIPCGWQSLGIVHPTVSATLPTQIKVALAIYGFGGSVTYHTPFQTYKYSNCEGIYLLFANRRGGIDTIQVVESTEQTTKTEKETFRRTWRMDSFAAVEIYKKTNFKTFKVKTSPIDEATANWIIELFQSRQAWQHTEGGVKIPIIITSDAVQLTDDKTDLFTINFEYQHAIEY